MQLLEPTMQYAHLSIRVKDDIDHVGQKTNVLVIQQTVKIMSANCYYTFQHDCVINE